jgi:predicted ATPase with chaperone activity
VVSASSLLITRFLWYTEPVRKARQRSIWVGHTVSYAGLVGGGQVPRPGEISLAHRGVLFLDELPEFGTKLLEMVRQPLEDRQLTSARSSGSLTIPASFMLFVLSVKWPGWVDD